MQGIDATFDDLSFEGGDSPRRVLLKIVPGAAAVALAGAVGVWLLHWCGSAAPEAIFSRWTPAPVASGRLETLRRHCHRRQAARPTEVGRPRRRQRRRWRASKPPRAFLRRRSRCRASNRFRPLLLRRSPLSASLPLPPAPDLPEVGETESFPLPPPRPPGFGAPAQPQAPERHAARPEVAVARPAAPADNRNVIEKLFGWGRTSSPAVASAAPARAASPAARRRAARARDSRPRQRPTVRLPVAVRRFGPDHGLRL